MITELARVLNSLGHLQNIGFLKKYQKAPDINFWARGSVLGPVHKLYFFKPWSNTQSLGAGEHTTVLAGTSNERRM